MNCLPALVCGELIENRSYARGIQYRLLALDPDSSFGQTKAHASAVPGVAFSNDIAVARQPVDHQRHGGRGHTHVRGQRQQSGRLDFIQMIENASLVRAEDSIALRIGDVARVTRKVDAWVERH